MTTYKSILRLSLPIMVGSAVQNLITLTDTIFLGRVGRVELGAIGLVGVFYLLITSIGYSFTKAGQIMIARRAGAKVEHEVGMITHAMAVFSLMLAVLMFAFMYFGGELFFSWIISTEQQMEENGIYDKCIQYLDYRCYGVFFSYLGVVFVSMYTGVARTTVIIYNALVMGFANTILNYSLIFGNFGMPEMGIAGAALASTLSEVLAFSVFVIYVLFDKKAKDYRLFKLPKVNVPLIKAQIKLSFPIVLQSIASVGSWFVFFTLVEKLGEEELAISNIIRAAYMIFMIPAWGFSSGINTIVSSLIGKKQLREVMRAIFKTAVLCFGVTMTLATSVILFPNYVLQIGSDDPVLIRESVKLVWVLIVILAFYSISVIYFNGLMGTGATQQALWIQISCVMLYVIYVYVVVGQLKAPLAFGWMAELVYFVSSWIISFWYLKSQRWLKIKIM